MGSPVVRERPYLPVVVGVITLGIVGLIPVLGLLVSIAGLLGFGAVLIASIRTIRGTSPRTTGTAIPLPAPTGA
jgi:hypothetical protein